MLVLELDQELPIVIICMDTLSNISEKLNKADECLFNLENTMKFMKAERKKAKLRLALTGPSGSGKTYGALLIAKGLGGSIAVIDTEKGSASLYSHLVDFDVLELEPPYTPERFTQAIESAEKAGYDNLIIDSITHEWSGVGGCLELNEELAKSRFKGNTWSAWNETTPRHRAFLDKITASKMHVIATMRSKTETSQQEGANGRKQVVKLGMKAEQRDGAEYEFTTVLDIVHDGHFAVASKDRTGLFVDKDPKRITPETGELLLDWLENGVDAEHDREKNLQEEILVWQASIEGSANLAELAATWQTMPKHLRKQLESKKDEIKSKLT